MDYSVAVIPVTKADKSVDLFDNDYAPLNEVDKINWESCESISRVLLRSYTCFPLAYVNH